MNTHPVTGFLTTAFLSGVLAAGCAPNAEKASADANPAAGKADEKQTVKTLGDADFEKSVATGVTLVDFWAPWCGPCRMQGPIVEKAAEAISSQAVVAKLNVDDNSATAEKFDVSSIPTLIVFKNGKPVRRFVGVQDVETLMQAIEAAGRSTAP